jgi:hypothetical protein
MRVVVHHPERTEEDGTVVAPSVAAFRVGRIEDHTDLLTGETTPREKVAEILLAQAKEENPGCAVKIEYLHSVETETDPETGNTVETQHEWRPEPPAKPAAPGENHEQVLPVIEQAQEASS